MTPPRSGGELPQLLVVGTLVRAHGVRGELKLKASPHQVPLLRELAERAEPITLRMPSSGDEYEITFAHVRGADSAPIAKVDGVDDRTAAERFRGAEVCVARELLPPPEEDEYFLADIEGCVAHDVATGARVGEVVRAELLPANIVLTVRMDDGGARVLAPFAGDAVPNVDVAARRLDLDLAFLGVDAAGAELP